MLYQHKFLSGGSRVRWIIICFAILLTSNSSWSMKMPKKKDLANNNAFILAEQVWSLTHTYLFVVIFLLCRKIPKIGPGAYIFQMAFLRGLYSEGNLRFKINQAYLIVRSKFAIFALFYFVFKGNFPSTSPRGAYIWRGDLKEGFLRYEFGGLIFEGAYFRNFTVSFRYNQM